MKKLITYETDQIKQLTSYLDRVTVTGVENCKMIALVAQIVEAGVSAEVHDSKKEEGD